MTVDFIELQNLGFNKLTLVFFMTTCFSLWGAWGAYTQIQKVKEEGAGSVSVLWSMTILAMFCLAFPYGWMQSKLALVILAFCRAPFYMRILHLLYLKKEKYSKTEWAWGAFLTLFVIVGYYVDISVSFLILGWVGAIAAIDQPYQILKKKSSKGVSIQMMYAYVCSVAFWVIYGTIIEDWYIAVWGFSYLVVYLAIVILYYRYRPSKV